MVFKHGLVSPHHARRLREHIGEGNAVEQAETGMAAEAFATRRWAGEAAKEAGELAGVPQGRMLLTQQFMNGGDVLGGDGRRGGLGDFAR